MNVKRNNDAESNTDKCIKPVQNFTSMDELKKEYAKQELLIAGYQRENEKLYATIKKLHKVSLCFFCQKYVVYCYILYPDNLLRLTGFRW